MPFIPPSLETLLCNTKNMDARFSTQLGRYQINSSRDRSLNDGVLLIQRITQLAQIQTERKSQLSVFIQLVNELREVINESTEHSERAVQILLGALIHRYFRLLKSYDKSENNLVMNAVKFSVSFFSGPIGDVTGCRLFEGLRFALQLPPIAKTQTDKNWRKKDLALLDPVTIVTALKCFRLYMLHEERYKKYPHFVKDQDNGKIFVQQLDEIIAEHTTRAAPIVALFDNVSFLQSLAKAVKCEFDKTLKELDNWHKLLCKQYKEFSSLSADVIKNHMEQNVLDLSAKKRLIMLLQLPYISNELFEPNKPATITSELFLSKMRECNSSIFCYVMVGGYALILEKLQKNKSLTATHELTESIERLRHCMLLSFNVVDGFDGLTRKCKSQGIKLLQDFIDIANPDLDVQCFGAYAQFKTEVAQSLEELLKPESMNASFAMNA